MTVVFDRGGWSPKLFARLIAARYDLITYRKGRVTELAATAFEARAVVTPDGDTVTLHLHEEPASPMSASPIEWPDGTRRPLLLLEITKLNPATGKQTRVVTTRSDLPAEVVLHLLFARWRQENFFKYMREELAIDALVEHGAEDISPELDRPNPAIKAIEHEMAKVQARIVALQGQRCELIGEHEPAPPVAPGWVKFVPQQAQRAKLLTQIRELKLTLQELDARRAELPPRVSAQGLERLKTGRKHVTDLFKMVAYQIETELVRMVAPHYARRADDARALVAAAFASSADLQVTPSELRVTLAPQSSPHRTRAIAALCDCLNQTPAKLPGTALRLRLKCAPDPD
jgi:hypothetical protein